MYKMTSAVLPISFSVASSWETQGSRIYQYNISVTNTSKSESFVQVYVRSTNVSINGSWSCTPKKNMSNVFGFPSFLTILNPGQSWLFGVQTVGLSTFEIESSLTSNTFNTTTFLTTTPLITNTAFDKFGIVALHPSSLSSPREWFCKWDKGPQRSFTFGPAGSNDPQLIFRGYGAYTIYGASNSQSGIMKVTGASPRIYVRGSSVESDNLPSSVPIWKNVEITFYANTTNAGSNISYAGIEAVARTNHYPDSKLCTTRGYGGKINFDGRVHFEKECCHGKGDKQTKPVYPFTNKGRMPLNKWIGYKYVVRACENNTKVKLELYMDLTNGKNGGTWYKLTEFVDYDGWSADTPSCCDAHKGKVLTSPYFNNTYSVYLRTDGLGKQLYKKFSIREIDPLP